MSKFHRAAAGVAAVALMALAACTDGERVTAPEPVFDVQQAPANSIFDGTNPVVEAQDLAAIQQVGCVGGEAVLLIQNNVPWFAPGNQHPLGANVTELLAQGKNFCMINSSQIGATNLAQFSEILISGAQNQTFYNDLFPGGVVHPAISAFVHGGGILSASLVDRASGPGNGGSWVNRAFVGGLRQVPTGSGNNNIVAAAHPIITDALPCLSGNCAPIVDAGIWNDLDGWGSSSHGYFTDLPAGTTTILDDGAGRPVFIEYQAGGGVVIASMTTTEWRYVGNFGSLPQNLKLLANDIAYQDFIAVLEVDIDIKPGSDPNSIKCDDDKGVIPVAILTTDQFDATSVDHTTVSFEGATETHVNRKTGLPRRHEEDVDGDGDIDLVFHFRLVDTRLTCSSTEGTLTGETFDGTPIGGTDATRMIPFDPPITVVPVTWSNTSPIPGEVVRMTAGAGFQFSQTSTVISATFPTLIDAIDPAGTYIDLVFPIGAGGFEVVSGVVPLADPQFLLTLPADNHINSVPATPEPFTGTDNPATAPVIALPTTPGTTVNIYDAGVFDATNGFFGFPTRWYNITVPATTTYTVTMEWAKPNGDDLGLYLLDLGQNILDAADAFGSGPGSQPEVLSGGTITLRAGN
jgi:hypothetical protein